MPIFPANGDVEMQAEDALLFDFEEEVEGEVLVDEGDHDVPFDVAEVPQQLEAVDGHRQEDVNVSLYENDGAYGQDHVDKFKASAVKGIRLSTLRYMHENKRAMAAIGLLKRRHWLEVDGEYVVDVHGANMVARVAPHYLDFVLYVGSRRGLDAALPNADVDHTWSAKLKLNLGHRQWPESRQGALGFDPKGRMMYVGNRLEEQLWIAMLPNEYLEGGEWGRVVEMEGTTRAVSTQHRYMLMMFLAYVLDEMRHEDIACITPYPEPLTLESIKESTEILGRFDENNREITLRLNDMGELHRHLMNSWDRWVNGAPASWKRDGFLTGNSPVGVCMLYGQNQPIAVAAALEEEKRNWERDRNYRHIRHMSFSLATHLSYLDVQEWEDIPIHVIEQNNGVLFDRPDTDGNRREVEVRELDLVDEEGFEINVYNEAGYRVPRRRPREFRTCGVMLDLERVHELFKGQEEEGGEVRNGAPFYAYPLAFSRRFGNVKSPSVITNFKRRLERLNEGVCMGIIEGEMEDDDDEEMWHLPHHRRRPAIRGIGCQIYNALSHRVRREAKFHAVQLGMVTSTFAGSGIQTASGQRRWRKRMEFCNGGLPHVRFGQKVSGAGQPQALRFENTYMLDVKRLREEDRNGRRIYERVLCPLLKMWSHPNTMGAIKDATQAFQPEMIPDLFKCGTYPITALIEMFWKKYGVEAGNQRMIDASTIEVMSMLERTLNYGHTGNAAVLTKRLMDRAWLSLGLINDGFPVLADTFIAHGALQMGNIMVRRQSWPVEADTYRPMTSSKRSQQLTYGEAHYEAYEARFTIQLAMENLPNTAYPNITDTSFRQACYAADVAFKVYFDDVKKLVHSGITSELEPQLSSPQLSVRQSARERMTALSRWMDEKNPLSYNTGILSNLLQAITQPENGKFELTTSVLGKKPTTFIADIMIKQCSRLGNQNQAPFIKGGNFMQVARVAIEEMGKAATRAGRTGADHMQFIADAICMACEHLKINHMPWSRNPTGGAGRPSSMVTYEVWLNLGAKAAPSINTHPTIYPGQQSSASLAYRASKDIQAGDARGDWSVMEVHLNSFDKVLHKGNLPTEWEVGNIEGGGMPEYIVDAYRYVQNTYDGTKALHQLAIICAVICAGLLPSIFCPKIGDYPSNTASYGEFVRNLEWVERDRKGARHAGRFITMVSGFIICLFEGGSPIRLRIQRGQDMSAWWAKHTAKGINAFLLVRLGLASIASASGFRSAKWNKDIIPLNTDRIKERHVEVVRLMRTGGKYGGFDAVRYLVGMNAARILATNHYVTSRTLSTSSMGGSSSKRNTREWEVDDGVVECGSIGTQRKVSRRG
ncbi:hypothetical protein PISMIDRAFT_11857 [Pisolithus microcarpus 441]|uniref:DUF8190 domain-containing protein n=1 Tax=Pisolithus microcarpus 441 TaxID=765257 RepID=A0A0C9YZF0_9AGAM|nr:hypothetical protein PISMIDRAFT_11857 [Pisolithus microcarpus 441]